MHPADLGGRVLEICGRRGRRADAAMRATACLTLDSAHDIIGRRSQIAPRTKR